MSALFGTLWGTPGGEGGSATVNGDGIDTTQAVEATPLMFDIEDVSRPVAVDLRPDGNVLRVSTATDSNAFLDADDPAWTTVRENSLATIEFITSKPIKGVQVRRTVNNGGSSSVRVYAPQRGGAYNPVYDPNYDVAPIDLVDAKRFFEQATMGAAFDEPETFEASPDTFGTWITAQQALATPTLEQQGMTYSTTLNSFDTITWNILNSYALEPAQLKLRVAHVMSQIFATGRVNGNSRAGCPHSWWQRLFELSQGNFRDLLMLSITHTVVGAWLDNMGNSAYNKPPSQNFSRELFQLFSLGVLKLNDDGSLMLDGNGQPIETYTQADVVAAANYLCGWRVPNSWTGPGNQGSPINGDMMTSPQFGGTKITYNGVPLPVLGFDETDYPCFVQTDAPTDAQVVERAEAIVDIIMKQPTTGVYISKQMIQKMVKDSPSPQYIQRVVAAWRNNGSGVDGDLAAVTRAILLDPEARGSGLLDTAGRAQEWVLSVTKRLRYGGWVLPSWADGVQARIWATYNTPGAHVLDHMGQKPADAISVFNDYPFQFEIAGVEAPAAAMWSAGTMLANVSNAMSYSATLGAATDTLPTGDHTGRILCTGLVAFYDAAYAAAAGSATDKRQAAHYALVDRVYADIHQGDTPTTEDRAEMFGMLETKFSESAATRERVVWLIQFVSAVPRAAVTI